MQPPDALIKQGINHLPTVGDGRQSGTSESPSILNASFNLSWVVDLPFANGRHGAARSQHVDPRALVPEADWQQRRDSWKAPNSSIRRLGRKCIANMSGNSPKEAVWSWPQLIRRSAKPSPATITERIRHDASSGQIDHYYRCKCRYWLRMRMRFSRLAM